jgi:DNA-binding transcriptional ArsR family regulator
VVTHASFEPGVLLEALADPSRRAIVTILCRRPTSVTALADALPVSRPAVSQHLRVLKDVGLVVDRAAGTRRIYSVQPEALAAIRGYFDDFWQQSLMAFRLAAETSSPSTQTQEEP